MKSRLGVIGRRSSLPWQPKSRRKSLYEIVDAGRVLHSDLLEDNNIAIRIIIIPSFGTTIRSFVRSFYPFTQSFCSFISFVHLFICSFVHLFIRSVTRSVISLVHFVRLFVRSFTRSFVHTFVHSYMEFIIILCVNVLQTCVCTRVCATGSNSLHLLSTKRMTQ